MTQSPDSKTFEISRLLDAPRADVWTAFTELEHLRQWWGPAGLAMRSSSLDLRPGGVFHYGMDLPLGAILWGRWGIRAVEAPKRLEWINSFSDPQGGIARHPMAPGWPEKMLCTVTFAVEGKKTRVTLRSVAFEASPAEEIIFVANFASLTQGFGGTLDKLAAHLAKG